MKSFYLTSILLFAISVVGFTQTKNFIDQPYIEVSGSGDSSVTPNQIFIKIIISEKDNKDRVPVEESEVKMIAAIKTLGINTELYLTTSDLISNYKFYLLKQKDILKSKEYILQVTDASVASKVFISLEDLGISNTSIDRVDHTDLENIKNICRTKAIGNAKEKALSLTKSIGQTVGNAIHISDNETNFDNLLQVKIQGLQIKGYDSFKTKMYEQPKIEFEKIKVRISVSAKFILK